MDSICVMTYNICGYNNDKGTKGFPVIIRDEKVRNLKQMLMEYGPDFVGLQEDYKYIDKEGSDQARAALFDPVWRFRNGTTETTIRAKYGAIAGTYNLSRFSTGRFFCSAVFRYPKGQGQAPLRILFISCHPSAYVENEGKRKIEYGELFQLIQDSSVLWDHCIIAGDFNTNTASDKALLRELCEKNGFDMAFGTYMPWLPTCYGHDGKECHSFDNILVSSGLTIRRVMILRDWYDRLYSDHVPVVCEVVI